MTTRGRQRRRGKEGRGHRGLKREVCRAQLFPIQCGAVFANTLNESERRRKGGDWLADWRAESSSAAAAEYKSFASRRDRCCVFHWVFYLRKIYLSAAKTNLNNKKSQARGKMDVLPMCSIFQELQIVHDTGYFSALPSLEEYWQQVNIS